MKCHLFSRLLVAAALFSGWRGDAAEPVRPAKKTAPQAQLEQAIDVLGRMRVVHREHSFGGRVPIQADVKGLAKKHYGAVEAANQLAEDPELSVAANAFVRERVSIPEDLRKYVARPKETSARPLVEPAGELGRRVAHDEVEFNKAFSRVQNGVPLQPGDLDFDDPSVIAIASRTTSFRAPSFHKRWTLSPADHLPLFRFFARAAELGHPLKSLNEGLLNQFMWPGSEEVVAVLRRVVKAYGLREQKINFAGGTLADYRPGTLEKMAIGRERALDSEKILLTADDAEFIRQARDRGSVRLLIQSMGLPDDPQKTIAALRAWNRALAIGAPGAREGIEPYLRWPAPAIFENERTMAELIRLMERAKIDPHSVEFVNGVRMDESPTFLRVRPLLDRVRLGMSAPVPNRRVSLETAQIPLPVAVFDGAIDKSSWENLWATKNSTVYRLTPDRYLTEIYLWNHKPIAPSEWLPYLPHPDAVNMAARVVELGGVSAREASSRWLSGPIEMAYSGDDYVLPIARLARACQVPFSEVKLTGAHGEITTLDQNPIIRRALLVESRRAQYEAALLVPPAVPIAPNGSIGEEAWKALHAVRDPSYYRLASDDLLRPQLAYTYSPRDYHVTLPDPGAVTMVARMLELGAVASRKVSQDFLRALPSAFTGDDYILPLARLARVCGVPLHDVTLELGGGRTMQLDAHPLLHPRVAEGPARRGTLQESLRALAGHDAVAALETLIDPVDGFEFSEIVTAAVEQVQRKKLSRIEMSKLSVAERERTVSALIADNHLGMSVVLAGLFVEGGLDELSSSLPALGYNRVQIDLARESVRALQKLSPRGLKLALGDFAPGEAGDFWTFPLRLELAQLSSLNQATGRAAFARHGEPDRVAALKALLDRVSLPRSSEAERRAVRELLSTLAEEEKISADDLRAAMAGGRHALVHPEIERELSAAIEEVLEKKPDAVARLAKLVKRHKSVIDPADSVNYVLTRIYREDLKKVLPLDEVDRQLGKVQAKSGQSTGAVVANDPEMADVAGIELLARSEDENVDVRAIPRPEAADLVLTPIVKSNLRKVAIELASGGFVLLEGPTGSAKTALARYIAWKTHTPYRRINVSYNTDISDLMGRYVGGEKKYSATDLAQEGLTDLHAIARDYAIDPGMPRAALTREILEVQERARWVDGPVVKAMRRGEELVLDEVDLMRAGVLDTLGSLMDDDGNVRVTQHKNEVIRPARGFMLLATGNGATYAGRGKLSAAQRSRWTTVACRALEETDLTAILRQKFGDAIPKDELGKLIKTHVALAQAADAKEIGQSLGRLAYSVRNILKVARRFVRYHGTLPDDALMRREIEEVYRGGLYEPADRKTVDDILLATAPYDGEDFYKNLEFFEDDRSFTLGDVTLRKLNTGHDEVPGTSAKQVLTARTKKALYLLMKAIDNGENPLLLGERAAGKTALVKFLAHLLGQPYYRQMFGEETDTMDLIGGYDETGWSDGMLLRAARPENVPGVALFDEYNLAPPQVTERFNSVLDDERTIMVTEQEGATVRLHPDFIPIVAFNPPTPRYPGRKKLSPASWNRHTPIYVEDLSDLEEQKEILVGRAAQVGVPVAIAETLVELHHWIIARYADGTFGGDLDDEAKPDLTIRQLMRALNTVRVFGTRSGYGTAFLNAVEAKYASTTITADNEAILRHAEEMAK